MSDATTDRALIGGHDYALFVADDECAGWLRPDGEDDPAWLCGTDGWVTGWSVFGATPPRQQDGTPAPRDIVLVRDIAGEHYVCEAVIRGIGPDTWWCDSQHFEPAAWRPLTRGAQAHYRARDRARLTEADRRSLRDDVPIGWFQPTVGLSRWRCERLRMGGYLVGHSERGDRWFVRVARGQDARDGTPGSQYPGEFEVWEHAGTRVIIHDGNIDPDGLMRVTRATSGRDERVHASELVQGPDGCRAADTAVLLLQFERWAREGVSDAMRWLYRLHASASSSYVRAGLYGVAAMRCAPLSAPEIDRMLRTLDMGITRFCRDPERERQWHRQVGELRGAPIGHDWEQAIELAQNQPEHVSWTRGKQEARSAFESIEWTAVDERAARWHALRSRRAGRVRHDQITALESRDAWNRALGPAVWGSKA